MNSPKEDKRTGFILMWIGVIPVVWAALMAAPFLSEGLAGIVEGFMSGMRNPMKISWCADSMKAILIFLVVYGMSIGVYYSTRRNYRKGEEHGSAKWGDPRQICRKYAEKDKGQNVILTQNMRIGLDGRKHRRNLNVLVVGGSGAGKTRFYAKPSAPVRAVYVQNGIAEDVALKVEKYRQARLMEGSVKKDDYVKYMKSIGMSTEQINIVLAEANKNWKPIE